MPDGDSLVVFSFSQDVSQYHSSIPLAPRQPTDEDEESNTALGANAEVGEEAESDAVLPRHTSELRSKRNQDRDSAKEDLTRGRKRSLIPSDEEGSRKFSAVSPGHGKVAPIRKKVLTTLAGRRVGPSHDDAGGSKPPTSPSTQVKASVAPPRRTLKTVRK